MKNEDNIQAFELLLEVYEHYKSNTPIEKYGIIHDIESLLERHNYIELPKTGNSNQLNGDGS